MKRFLVCLFLIVAAGNLAPVVAQTAYQTRIYELRERLEGPWSDTGAPPERPKLDDAIRERIKGELMELDPYWRLEQELTADVAVVDLLPREDLALRVRAAAYCDIRGLVRTRCPVRSTQEQAEAEVAQIRLCLIRGDVEGVKKISADPQSSEVQTPPAPASPPYFALVDLQRAFAGDPKTKALELEINESRNQSKHDVDPGVEAVEKRCFQAYVDLRRAEILAEIDVAIDDLVILAGSGVVLDKSAKGAAGTPVILYSRGDLDFTESVLHRLDGGDTGARADPLHPQTGLHVATVRAARALKLYPGAKAAEEAIEAERLQVEKEVAERKAATDHVRSSLSAAEVETRVRDDLEFAGAREKAREEHARAAREKVTAELAQAVRRCALVQGVDMVLDGNAQSRTGIPLVSQASDELDLTDEVVRILNGAALAIPTSARSTRRTLSFVTLAALDSQRAFRRIPVAEPFSKAAKRLSDAMARTAHDGRCTFVLDATGQTLNGVPLVLRQQGLPDLTDSLAP